MLVVLLAGCTSALAPQAQRPSEQPTDLTPAALLVQRAADIVAHDRGGLAAETAAHAEPGVRDLGLRTASLHFTSFSYGQLSEARGPVAGERTVTATVHYRLDDDAVDAVATRRLVFVHQSSPGPGWLLRADDPVGPDLPWDLGPVAELRGPGATVLTVASVDSVPVEVSNDLLYVASAAARSVTAVWGTGWGTGLGTRPVVVAVPGPAQLAALTGRSLAGVGSGATGLVAIATADRVYVDLAAYTAIDPAGRRVLLTHEVTHLATSASGDRTIPQWLKEGLADYVGFLGSGIGVTSAAGPLLARVRHAGPPAALPLDRDFRPGVVAPGYTLGDAYSASWLMCRLIAQESGQRALVLVYRAASAASAASPATTGDAPERSVDAALLRYTGRPLSAWLLAWRQELRGLAG